MKGYNNIRRNLVNFSTLGEMTNILTFYGHFCLLLFMVWTIVRMLFLRLSMRKLAYFAGHPWHAKNYIEYIIFL